MPTHVVAREFDLISPQYDATRSPVDAATLDGMARVLHDREVERILEVGIGTGRVALPLEARGFEVTGVDASPGMLGQARAKGLRRLVRGSAYHLPFRDEAFDATLFVHVLHLLDDPPTALHEADRVGRTGAFALLHPPAGLPSVATAEGREEGRRAVYRALLREGVELPGVAGGPRIREQLLLQLLPPDELVVLSDREVTERLDESLLAFERRATRHALAVPEATLARAVASARAELGDRTATVRRIQALAHWNPRHRPRRRR